ncbi:MAG: response regulator [Deltaproteobacteria bacterium]|nr:response regulator [Deltaproteobacteria bacterium]MBZ0219558.1 response regulator [Deltaproteobacteria bacterium]
MNEGLPGRPMEILMVEDNPYDIRLTIEAFREAKVSNKMHLAADGEEAIEFLRRKGKHRNAPRPDLILLDLNLPKMNGMEVLSEIKADPDTRRIPVVVLTSSADDNDVSAAYGLHTNAYITKTADVDRFITIAKAVEDFWFSIVKLPQG